MAFGHPGTSIEFPPGPLRAVSGSHRGPIPMVIGAVRGQARDMSENFANRPQEGSAPDSTPSAGPSGSPGTPSPGPAAPDPGNQKRRLERTKEGRMIAGVCSGAGAYLGIDPNIIRVVLAVLTFFGGTGVAAYVIGWLLLPEEGTNESIAQDLFNKAKK
jgi:phage shock protein PspC (stress-responsive transcriptional regulator)